MISARNIKAIEDLIDYCYDNVPYFGTKERPGFSPEVDTESLGRRAVRALATLKNMPDKAVVQIGVEGGIVQGASANVPIKVVVFDYDTDMGDDDRLTSVPQCDGMPDTQAFVAQHEARVNRRHIRRVLKCLEED